jgi:hypothetical protein
MLLDESWLPDPPDKQAIQCNYTETTSAVANGSRAYVTLLNPGSGNSRIMVIARSRGGRFVEKWENIRRLDNFRIRTVHHSDPLYHNHRLYILGDLDRALLILRESKEYLERPKSERQEREAYSVTTSAELSRKVAWTVRTR